MSGFTTRTIHAPFLEKDLYGSLHMPACEAASFEYADDLIADISQALEN